VFCTAPAIRNTVANIITEVIGTFVLVFGVLAIFADKATGGHGPRRAPGRPAGARHRLVARRTDGVRHHPARDLGPRIAIAAPIPGKGPSDWGYAWIPVLAPLAGGMLGALCFDWWFPG